MTVALSRCSTCHSMVQMLSIQDGRKWVDVQLEYPQSPWRIIASDWIDTLSWISMPGKYLPNEILIILIAMNLIICIAINSTHTYILNHRIHFIWPSKNDKIRWYWSHVQYSLGNYFVKSLECYRTNRILIENLVDCFVFLWKLSEILWKNREIRPRFFQMK